jgi:hypothetical protein
MILDVFGLAGNAITSINPQFSANILYSTGVSVVNDDGSQVPIYNSVSVMIEVQAASSEDLKQIETISQQGDYRVVYVYGALNALNRPLQIGGDKLQFYGSTWLVTQQLEDWGNGEWSKVVATRQIAP